MLSFLESGCVAYIKNGSLPPSKAFSSKVQSFKIYFQIRFCPKSDLDYTRKPRQRLSEGRVLSES